MPSSSEAEGSVVPRVPRARRLCVKNTFLTVEDKRAANLLPRSRTLPTPALLSIDEQGEERFWNQRMDDPMYMNTGATNPAPVGDLSDALGAPNPGAVGDLSDALGLEPALSVPRPVFLESRRSSPGNSKPQSVSDWSVRSQDLDCPMPYNRDLPEGWDADSGGLKSPLWQHEDFFDSMQDLPGHPSPPVVQDLISTPLVGSSTEVQEGEVTVSRRVKVKNTFLTVEEPSQKMAMPRSRTLPVPSSLSSLDPCDNLSQDQGPCLAKLDSQFSAGWSMPATGAGPLSVNSLTEPTISANGFLGNFADYATDARGHHSKLFFG